jgi:hypothetical protein
VPRQPFQRGRLAGTELTDKLADDGLPPGQDLLRGTLPGRRQVQGQRPSRARARAPHQPGRFQAVREAYGTRMGQAQSPAHGTDRLARVVSQRHQRGRLGPGQPVRLLLGYVADPVADGQRERAEQVGRPRI